MTNFSLHANFVPLYSDNPSEYVVFMHNYAAQYRDLSPFLTFPFAFSLYRLHSFWSCARLKVSKSPILSGGWWMASSSFWSCLRAPFLFDILQPILCFKSRASDHKYLPMRATIAFWSGDIPSYTPLTPTPTQSNLFDAFSSVYALSPLLPRIGRASKLSIGFSPSIPPWSVWTVALTNEPSPSPLPGKETLGWVDGWKSRTVKYGLPTIPTSPWQMANE